MFQNMSNYRNVKNCLYLLNNNRQLYRIIKLSTIIFFQHITSPMDESHHEKTCFLHMKNTKAYMSLVMRKPAFCICEKKTQISFAVTAKLISAFVFAIRIVQSLYYLNPKFQASSHLLWLYSPVCVGPGQKP